MKKQLILGSTLLFTSMALHIPSAMAYSSEAEAFFIGADPDVVIGETLATNSAPGVIAEASIDGFTLHSTSSLDFSQFDLGEEPVIAGVSDENLEELFNETGFPLVGAIASWTETFIVTGAGAAALNFQWDGTLSSDAGSSLTAGYLFGATAFDSELTKHGVNANGSGISIVDSSGSIALFFTEDEIGTTFDVDATLLTIIGLIAEGFGEDPTGIAIADFSNSATFSFTGGIAVAPVPVPAAVWLLGSALIGLVGIRRRTA